jgi:hypothetical protein
MPELIYAPHRPTHLPTGEDVCTNQKATTEKAPTQKALPEQAAQDRASRAAAVSRTGEMPRVEVSAVWAGEHAAPAVAGADDMRGGELPRSAGAHGEAASDAGKWAEDALLASRPADASGAAARG